MKSINRKLLSVLLVIDGLLLIISGIFGGYEAVWNSQIGFVSATLVMLGSMQSYKRMVDARVEHEVITTDIDKDVIDKLEDPYDLYSESIEEEEEKGFKEVVKEEKKRLKADRRSLFQILKDTKAALSFYRLGAYAVLILGFLYLNRHGMLHIPSYIVGLSLPSLIIVAVLISAKEQRDAHA